MILGDFNAAGSYLSKKKKKKIRISSPPFYWLIDDNVDTTTSNFNKNTYDRLKRLWRRRLTMDPNGMISSVGND
ncbi:hypothetical protein ILYODFUR_036839 [Ilyodon furcidens]|uniref:Uncharacterized protein n=1 Tax=Ilyodon furcidens TaxID=33524 RepID=A0ABV0U0T9_9TELE